MRVLFIGLALLCACARVTRTAFDQDAGTFRLCGNKWADPDDYAHEARNLCAAPEQVTCGMSQVGSYSQQHGKTMVSKPIYATCCEYRCPGGFP